MARPAKRKPTRICSLSYLWALLFISIQNEEDELVVNGDVLEHVPVVGAVVLLRRRIA